MYMSLQLTCEHEVLQEDLNSANVSQLELTVVVSVLEERKHAMLAVQFGSPRRLSVVVCCTVYSKSFRQSRCTVFARQLELLCRKKNDIKNTSFCKNNF